MDLNYVDGKVSALLAELERKKDELRDEYDRRYGDTGNVDEILDLNEWAERTQEEIYGWFFDELKEVANEAGY